MSAKKITAHVHRFHDSAALALLGQDGETVYMSAKEARELARTLNACARDIESRGFVASIFGSVGIELSGDKS